MKFVIVMLLGFSHLQGGWYCQTLKTSWVTQYDVFAKADDESISLVVIKMDLQGYNLVLDSTLDERISYSSDSSFMEVNKYSFLTKYDNRFVGRFNRCSESFVLRYLNWAYLDDFSKEIREGTTKFRPGYSTLDAQRSLDSLNRIVPSGFEQIRSNIRKLRALYIESLITNDSVKK